MSNKPILESGFWETTTFLSNFNFLSIVQTCYLSFMFKLEYYELNNLEPNNMASSIILWKFFERSLKPSYLTKVTIPLVHIILTFLWQLESHVTKAETAFTWFKDHAQGNQAGRQLPINFTMRCAQRLSVYNCKFQLNSSSQISTGSSACCCISIVWPNENYLN